MKIIVKLALFLLLINNVSNTMQHNDRVICHRQYWTACYCVLATCIFGYNGLCEYRKCEGWEMRSSLQAPNAIYLVEKKSKIKDMLQEQKDT